jgi:hypothetical protein
MRLFVVCMGKKAQYEHDLVVEVNRRYQSVMTLNVEDGHGFTAWHNNLVCRWEHLSEFNEIPERSAENEFLPMIKRARSRGMKFRISF